MTFGDFQLSGPRQDNLTAVIPVLPSRDIGASEALYRSLGFACVRAAPAYLIARKDWVELHFWHSPDHDPKTNAVSAYIRVRDVEPVAAGFLIDGQLPQGCRFHPPSDKAWGMRETHFIDHDGNLLNIGMPLDHSRWTDRATANKE
jgi:hypothetical protein